MDSFLAWLMSSTEEMGISPSPTRIPLTSKATS